MKKSLLAAAVLTVAVASNAVAQTCTNTGTVTHTVENGKSILKRIGFTKQHLKEEVYWIPAKGAATT